MTNVSNSMRQIITPNIDLMINNDDSKDGRRIDHNNIHSGGKCNEEESKLQINSLELLAVFLALNLLQK